MGKHSEVIAPLVVAQPESATQPVATPDNTPVPGGGSWHWDYSTACWVSNDTEQPAQE